MNYVIWLGFFTAVLLGWNFYLKARNKERMALIEKGIDVSEIYSKREIKFRFPWLKIGLLFIGIGLGVGGFFVLDSFVPAIHKIMMSGPVGIVVPIAIMMVFGGIGVIIGYYLDKPKD